MTPFLTPGDTKQDGFGNTYVLEQVKGTKLCLRDKDGNLKTVTLSEWEKWDVVRTARQEELGI